MSHPTQPPAKRQRRSANGALLTQTCLPHPRGVLPLGNKYFSEEADMTQSGRGSLRVITHDLLVELLGFLDGVSLARLSSASRAFYCWANEEELWKDLVISKWQGNFEFQGSWKNTFCFMSSGGFQLTSDHVRVKGVYSDGLFQSWYCSTAGIRKSWITRSNVQRISADKVGLEEFRAKFDNTGTPVIIGDIVNKWPAFTTWTADYMLKASEGKKFRIGGLDMTLEQYLGYADETTDDRPLYLFDCKFAEKVKEFGEQYEVPEYFKEDFFALLGDERPDYRWLIIGPDRSGSSFHIDPNATSAWNGVITGRKKWILFPPGHTPPGVFPSEDYGEVTSPPSLIEWFIHYYSECEALPPSKRPLECICEAGELLFIPRGWWHLVLNLAPSIAVTQNFVTQANLPAVLAFLRSAEPRHVSGVGDSAARMLHKRLEDVLREKAPEALAQAERAASGQCTAADAVKASAALAAPRGPRISELLAAGDDDDFLL